MIGVLLVLNAVSALAAVGFGVVGWWRPALLTATVGEVTPSARYFAAMYASRAIPFGLGTAVVCLAALGGADVRGPLLGGWLLIAAAMQVGDALIGWRHRILTMAIAPAVVAVVHLLGAALLGGR